MPFSKLVIFIIINFCFVFCKAQQPVFKNYSTQNGLPSSETYCILQDSKGYIWLSTDRGIVKFDGYNFKTFSNVDGLPDNTVFEIFEDSAQRIWYKTYSATIGYIKNDSVYKYTYNSVIKSIYPFQLVNAMLFDGEGKLWMTKHNLKGESLITTIDSNGKVSNINTDGKKRIYINKNGRCLIGGYDTLSKTEIFSVETQQKITDFVSFNSTMHDVFATPISAEGFFLCADNKVWRIKNGKAEKIIDCRGRILAFCVDAHKNIWIGNQYKGLELYEASAGYKEVKRFLVNLSPTSILMDNEGAFWFTTLENGIYYLPPSLPVSYTEKDGLSAAKVNKIIAIDDDIYFVLSNNDLVLKRGNTKPTIVLSPGEKAVFDIGYQKPDKVFYILPNPTPLSTINKKCHYLGYGKKISIGPKHIVLLNYMGVTQFDENQKIVANISFEKISRTTCAFVTKTGDLLVGSLDGVFLYKNNKIQSLKNYNTLYGHRVSDIKRINSRHIAIATIGQGLYIVDEGTYALVKHYSTNNGLPSMMCNTITVEENLTVWVGTNKGVCRIMNVLSANKSDFITMDVGEGVLSNEINDICIIDDKLWMATAKGVSIMLKNVWDKKIKPIPVYVENVTVNGEKVDKNSVGGFSFKQNNIRFSFVGLYYQNPAKLTYRYRLKGGDSMWYYTTNQSIEYNSLSHGKYTFEVGLVNPDGTKNPTVASYTFIITPPFYKTIWFVVLLIILVVLLIYVYVFFRIQFVRKQEQLKSDLNRFRDKALRDQMNPHFVYNSLNSIQNFILKNDTITSALLLSEFSQLMRFTFNNTSQERVTLEADIEALSLYARLENLRFQNKFDIIITIHPSINPQMVFVPPLLIQPFVENSIVHGLAPKSSKGTITITIKPHKEALKIVVTDDGVGRKEAAVIKNKKTKYNTILFTTGLKVQNSGIQATITRINQLWAKNLHKSEFSIVDLHDINNTPAGTTVQFCIPLYYD